MFETTNTIVLSGEEYPMKCDMLVLEKIQEEYGDLVAFENKLSGFFPKLDENGNEVRNEDGFMIGTYGMPDIRTVNKALIWFVQEGMEIAKEEGKEERELSDESILRKADMHPGSLGKLLRKEFSRCFERKNEQTTQREKGTAEEDQRE